MLRTSGVRFRQQVCLQAGGESVRLPLTSLRVVSSRLDRLPAEGGVGEGGVN